MPWWIMVYLAVFALMVMANSMHWILVKQKILLTIYGFAAGSYLIFLIIAYWRPELKMLLSPVNAAALFSIVIVDVYFVYCEERYKDKRAFSGDRPGQRVFGGAVFRAGAG